MKKTKLLMPLLAVAGIGATVAPMVAMTSCTTTKTLTYDQAKEWVKANYGEESTWVGAEKCVSKSLLNGTVTAVDYEKNIEQYLSDYFKGHITNAFIGLAHIQAGTEEAKKIEYKHEENTRTFVFETSKDAESPLDPNPFTEENFFAPLSYNNFDAIFNYYFGGLNAKKTTKFIVDGNKFKFVGNFVVYSTRTNDSGEVIGTDVLYLPDCTIAFDDKGRMSEISFAFEKDSEGRYYWNAVEKRYIGWIDFTLSANDYMSFKYSYKN